MEEGFRLPDRATFASCLTVGALVAVSWVGLVSEQK